MRVSARFVNTVFGGSRRAAFHLTTSPQAQNALRHVFAVFALLLATVSAHGATVIAFDRALPGQPFTINNPQTTTVTGTLRVHPRLAGPNSTKVVAFTLAAGERKDFANILQELEEPKPSIIRIESSQPLSGTLRPVAAGRSDSSSFVYTPGGTDPVILVPVLNGTVRVKIFATNTATTAVYSEQFTVNGEATIALQASAIIGAIRVPGGFVVVEPVTGYASVATSYVPSRRRSAGHSGLAPVSFTVSTSGCANATGATATVTLPSPGLTYSWSVLNGTPEGSTTNSLLAYTLGQPGYAAIRLTARDDRSSTSTETIIRVGGAPILRDSEVWASDALDGQTSRIHFGTGSGATSVTLFGTDFPSAGLQLSASEIAKGHYDVSVSGIGPHVFEVAATNACGTTSKRGSFSVTAPTPSGSITAPDWCVFGGPGLAITVVVENVPVGVEWRLRSAIGNGFGASTGGNTGVGSGTFTRYYVPANEPGQETITVEVDGVVFASAQVSVIQGGVLASPKTILLGQSSTLTVTFEHLPPGKVWTLRSAKGNSIDNATGTGNGTFTRQYVASVAKGEDWVTLEIDGVFVYEDKITVN